MKQLENNNLNLSQCEYKIEEQQLFSNTYSKIYHCTQKGISQPIKLCAKISVSSKKNKQIEHQKIYQMTRNNLNLVPIYLIQSNCDGTQFTTIMEKCQENLEQQDQQFNEDQINQFMSQFITGYQSIYYNKMIHGKINTNNIFINKFNTNKVYKIGDILSCVTSDNTNIGYIAPEVFPELPKNQFFKNIEGNLDGVAQDIYSLGMVLIKLIMGKLPFECTRDSMISFFNLIKSKPYRIEKNSLISQDLSNIIENMILYNPQDRISFNKLCQIEQFKSKQGFSSINTRFSQQFQQSKNQNHQYQTNIQQQIHGSTLISKSRSMIQFIQKNTKCFQKLITAKIRPQEYQTNSINSKTLRFKVIKKYKTLEQIQNFINNQLNNHQNNLSFEIQKAYNEILLGNMKSVCKIIESYNNKSCEYEDQEILFIYCLIAYNQGHQEIIMKSANDYKEELLDV